jgi:hypothetical protein
MGISDEITNTDALILGNILKDVLPHRIRDKRYVTYGDGSSFYVCTYTNDEVKKIEKYTKLFGLGLRKKMKHLFTILDECKLREKLTNDEVVELDKIIIENFARRRLTEEVVLGGTIYILTLYRPEEINEVNNYVKCYLAGKE